MTLRAIELTHHAGPVYIGRDENVPDEVTVYRYVRASHNFLNDENHFVALKDDDLNPVVHIYRNDDANGTWISRWFSQTWHVVTPETFDERIADFKARTVARTLMLKQHRDTVRGRKARRDDEMLISEFARHIRILRRQKAQIEARKYWPEHRW